MPQISIVCGPAAGGSSYGPALNDFVIMTGGASMFLTGRSSPASCSTTCPSTRGRRRRHAGEFREQDLYTGQEFRNTYERSKHEAELLLRGARDLPMVVARPSIVGNGGLPAGAETFAPYFDVRCRFSDARACALLAREGVEKPDAREYLERLAVFARRASWGKRPISREAASILARPGSSAGAGTLIPWGSHL